jgi:hypothetical protein
MATSTLNRDAQLSTLANAAYLGKPIARIHFNALIMGACMAASLATQAQTAPQGLAESSYVNRIIKRQGVHDADPNVYVYTAEFAKRFQMPEEWVSNELKGVDAVAFRVVPSYKWCGWGGDPKACSEQVSCEMDLYFDHKRNPLPWDERRPERYSGHYKTSVNFLSDGKPSLYYERLKTPARKDDHIFAKSSPFVDPKTGKGLWWQGQLMSLTSYDREIFSGVSLLTMFVAGCEGVEKIYLTSENDPYQETKAYMQARFPESWRVGVKQATKESKDRAAAFFKQEGEKAMKALRESPVPNKSIVPLQ